MRNKEFNFKKAIVKNLVNMIIGIFLYFYCSLLVFIHTGKYVEISKIVSVLAKQGSWLSCMFVYITNIIGLFLFFVALLDMIASIVLFVLEQIISYRQKKLALLKENM